MPCSCALNESDDWQKCLLPKRVKEGVRENGGAREDTEEEKTRSACAYLKEQKDSITPIHQIPHNHHIDLGACLKMLAL